MIQVRHPSTQTHVDASPLAQGFTLSITFFFRPTMKRELDGGLTITQDALCEALSLHDSRIQHLQLFQAVERPTPRTSCVHR